MTTLKIGDKEYQIKYGYEATAKAGAVKKLISLETALTNDGTNEEDMADVLQSSMITIAELFLVGLQKYHKDEFGYDYNSAEERDEKLELIYDLLDTYFDDEDGELFGLLGIIQKEMLENGFLSKMYNQGKSEVAKTTKKGGKKPVVVAEQN